MTQLFARFTAPGAPIHLPGAPFLASALLVTVCFAVFSATVRQPGAPEPAERPASTPAPTV